MLLSDKAVQEFKEIYKKEYGIELSDAEATECGHRVVSFFEILIGEDKVESQRKNRLEKEPQGFSLDESEGSYNCRVCSRAVSGKNAWWDLNGVKCLDCQRNIKAGAIPAEICQNDRIWFQNWQLQSKFGLHPSTIRKLRREGVLCGRDLEREDKIPYFTVYLVTDNEDFIRKYQNKKPQY